MKSDARPELARFIDRWTIEYVRVYPHPIERVWRAISDPAAIIRSRPSIRGAPGR